MRGLILLNKKSNKTSYSYISDLKKIFNFKHIGHTGTLDIDAEGLLVCALGDSCKCIDALMNTKKEYIAEVIFGISTDTEDITGNVLLKENTKVSIDEFNQCLLSFIGTYEQIPPMYSSKKINGTKLLHIAKQGEIVERKSCLLNIFDIKNIDIKSDIEKIYFKQFNEIINNENEKYKLKKENTQSFFIKVVCSKGTYIRTLCKDIGERLGVTSVMGALLRTKTSGYELKDAFTIQQIEEKVKNNDKTFILPAYYMKRKQVITFGKFASLHLGHQKIIKKVVEIAKENCIESLAIVIVGNKNNMLTKEQQMSLLKYYGIDNVIFFELDDLNKNMSGDYFVNEILINQMNAEYIVVGEDCSFGQCGKWHLEELKSMFKNVICIKKITVADVLENNKFEINENLIKKLYNIKDKIISSTLINECIKEKECDIVSFLTGRIYKKEKDE